jgi:hypothetical protein
MNKGKEMVLMLLQNRCSNNRWATLPGPPALNPSTTVLLSLQMQLQLTKKAEESVMNRPQVMVMEQMGM